MLARLVFCNTIYILQVLSVLMLLLLSPTHSRPIPDFMLTPFTTGVILGGSIAVGGILIGQTVGQLVGTVVQSGTGGAVQHN